MTVQPSEISSDDDEARERFRATLGEDAAVLVDVFLEDARDRLVQLRAALVTHDADALQQAAHALKGSSASFAADALAELAQALEMMGRRGTTDGADALVDQAEAEYRRIEPILEGLRDQGAA